MDFSLTKIDLPLKVVWKLSRGQTLVKENYIFGINNKYLGEIAPNTRYGETKERIENEYATFLKKQVTSLEECRIVLAKNDWCHSLKFGIESAFVHFEADKRGQSVEAFLGLQKMTNIPTSFSVPIMELAGIADYVKKLTSFPALKIKVNANEGAQLVLEVAKYFKGPLRVDGNEAWDSLEDYLAFEQKIAHLPIQFIEQPFKAQATTLYRKLFPISKFPIMADESIEDVADFSELKEMFHLINVKVMKAGGYYNSIELLKAAKENGLKTMIGCMIETGLGISSAMHLAELGDYFDLDGFLLLTNDPYPIVKNQDGYLS